MAIDYSITAKEIVKELGGDENIVNVTLCNKTSFYFKRRIGCRRSKSSKNSGCHYDCTGRRSISDCHWQSCVGCICFCDEIGARRIRRDSGYRKESRSCEPDHRCHFQHFCPIFIYIGGMWYLAGDSWCISSSELD